MADDRSGPGASTDDASGQKPKRGATAAARAKAGTDFVRLKLAQVIWVVCVLAALVLATGALFIALDKSVDPDNALVEFVLDLADRLDFGVFDRESGVFDFDGKNAETKNALVNWGIAAVLWLVVGKVLDRIIRP